MRKLIYSLAILSLFAFAGCSKEKGKELDSQILKINEWIQEDMSIYYKWNDKMPDINPAKEADPKEYFDKLLYKAEDKWSFITDEADVFINSLQGIETTYGYSLAFGIFSNTGNVFAVVEFVYPDTPASRAGIQRGDIIIGMNGVFLTRENYTDVVYKPSGNMMMGVYTTSGITQGGDIFMTAEELNLNPVLIQKVIPVSGGKKIGYLFYAQYITDYNKDLDAAFQWFKDESVSDVVLDLRYNPGGAVNAAIHLCSILAPINEVNNSSILMTMQWNTFLQDYFEQRNDLDFLQNTFDKTVPVNMNLNKLYILTSGGTASASELTITGLEPYVNVILIGETTYGKYAASTTFQPEDMELKNWAIQPIIYTFANSKGLTNFKDGFQPTHLIEEDIIRNPVPLGDETEPLLAKAIEEISGVSPAPKPQGTWATRAALPDYKIIDRRFSKFDQFKNTLIEERLSARDKR